MNINHLFFIVLTALITVSCSLPVAADIQPDQEIYQKQNSEQNVFTALNIFFTAGPGVPDLTGKEAVFYRNQIKTGERKIILENKNFNIFWREPGLGSWKVVLKFSVDGIGYYGEKTIDLSQEDPYKTAVIEVREIID
jgi:hypothetical protein